MTMLAAASQDHARMHQRGWAWSLLVHGLFGVGAMALMSGLSPSMEAEPFQWNVAMVESPPISPSSDPLPETMPPPRPTEPIAKPVQREALHAQEVRAVRPVPEVIPVDETPSQTASTILAQTVPHQEEIHEPVEPTPVQDTIVQEEPPIQTASVMTPEPPRQVVTEPQPAVASIPQETKPVEAAVATAPPQASVAAKADYAWLMKALLGRINELKNYPHLARINHWEGKVVLRAVIRDDGEVIMIDVQESSGRSILDNDAMETLRKASPLKLEQPLGKPQVAILMPISYSLR
ncbi:MAG: energy transducer TonB [Nitrospira sp.]|nr:energy transducer TonB [Nitrospira sp.]